MGSLRGLGLFLLLSTVCLSWEDVHNRRHQNTALDSTGIEADAVVDIRKRLLAFEQTMTHQYSTLEALIRKHLPEQSIAAEHLTPAQIIVQAINEGRFSDAEEMMRKLDDLTAINEVLTDVLKHSECKLGALVDLVMNLPDNALKDDILEHLFQLIKRNKLKVPTLIRLAEALIPRPSHGEEIDPLIGRYSNIVGRLFQQIEERMTDRLVEILESRDDYQHNEEVRELAASIAKWQEVSKKVMMKLVPRVFKSVDHNKVIDAVCSHLDAFQALVGVERILVLLEEDGPLDDSFALKITLRLKEIMSRPSYHDLKNRLKRKVGYLLERLPVCVRNLIFQPWVCIWNKLDDTFLVASSSEHNYDEQRRNIFTTPLLSDGSTPCGGLWKPVLRDEKLFFESVVHPKEMLYGADLEGDGFQHVFTWIPGDNMDNHRAWTLETHGEYCLLKNVKLRKYLSPSDSKHIPTENKYATLTDLKAENSSIVWQIRQC